MDGEKNGVLPIDDVKSALMCVLLLPFRLFLCSTTFQSANPPFEKKIKNSALGIPPSSPAELREFISILDPDGDGYATYEPFFAIAALKFHSQDQGATHQAEVDEAFGLFTNHQEGGSAITLAHLRRVAAVLKEDVDEELLKDMILEANGGAGVARGVRMDEFDEVMRRAGVWR